MRGEKSLSARIWRSMRPSHRLGSLDSFSHEVQSASVALREMAEKSTADGVVGSALPGTR